MVVLAATLEATKTVRDVLETVIDKYKITKLLDVGCGKMGWMSVLLEKISKKQKKFEYMGVDVVQSVIDTNRKKIQ